MNIKMEKVLERDIDLLIINQFTYNKNLINIFLKKINKNNYSVINLEHSLSDENGESDITVILGNDKEKIGILIENKIDAIAMPMQRDRYEIRGNKGISDKQYDSFYVFIIAPQDYLDTNLESKKYEYRISYEKLIEELKNDIYASSLLTQAIEEKKKGYSVIEDKNVTLFWQKYYDYIEKNYPKLNIKRYEGPRGSNAWWPGFIVPVKGLKIDHKSNRGDVDLSFEGLGNYYSEISNLLDGYLDENMIIVQTGKSMSIRIKVPIVKFNENFEDYIYEVNESLKAVERLYNLVNKINYNEILKLKKK